jgi:hypothetical protein
VKHNRGQSRPAVELGDECVSRISLMDDCWKSFACGDFKLSAKGALLLLESGLRPREIKPSFPNGDGPGIADSPGEKANQFGPALAGVLRV